MTYRVVAPYVTVKVPDASGKITVNGFYRDGVLPSSADPENVKILVGKGMVEKVSAALEPRPAPEPEPDPEPAEPGLPKDYASKADWVAYAVTQRPEGQSEDEARAEAQAMSKADLVATFGG